MPKAIVIVRMKTGATTRGQLDAGTAGAAVSFVHCGSVELPGSYKAMIISGSAAALTAITQHASFLVGQQITKSGEVENWADARTAIAPGARTKINNFLVANSYAPMTAQDSIVDLLRVFQPDYEPGIDNVWGNA